MKALKSNLTPLLVLSLQPSTTPDFLSLHRKPELTQQQCDNTLPLHRRDRDRPSHFGRHFDTHRCESSYLAQTVTSLGLADHFSIPRLYVPQIRYTSVLCPSLTPRSVREWYSCPLPICSSQRSCRPGISGSRSWSASTSTRACTRIPTTILSIPT